MTDIQEIRYCKSVEKAEKFTTHLFSQFEKSLFRVVIVNPPRTVAAQIVLHLLKVNSNKVSKVLK